MDEIMLDTPDPETTCPICYAEFLDPEDLTIHINQVHSTEIEASLYKCHFCTRSCTDLESYAVHIRNVHLCDLRCCKYCNRVFNDINEYKRHDKEHHRHWVKSKYYCSNCEMVFTTMSELEIHEFENHRDCGDGIFLNEVFPILSSLLNIKVTRFLQCLCEDDVLYVCVNCEHTTPNVSDYIEHLTKVNCRSLACDICWAVYKNRKSLIGHYNAHPECFHNVTVTKQCTECCKDFDVRTLKEHSKICKAIKCKRCEIVFETMNDLTKHQTEHHPAVVHLQVCKYCNKDFAGTAALEKHIQRSHESHFHLYKYKCIYCDVIFKHPKKLFAHFFSTHKDLEPYTCRICDKKFKIRKNFTLHIKLDHKSIGFVEFNEKYHVFFSAQKSENPFDPLAFYSKENVKKIDTIEDHTVESHTDVEQNDENDSALEKQVNKPKNKVQFNVADKVDKTNVKLVNVNSDFMSATETEGNQTEGEIEKTPALKRKIASRMNCRNRKQIQTIDDIVLSDSSDEDEPLLQVKKRAKKLHQSRLASASRTRNMKRFTVRKTQKNRFVCNICNKQCFTYQNYNNHIALHKNNVSAKCVKCQKVCKSKKALTDHYAKEHSSSKLTETLKNLLEKRKNLKKHGSKVEISKNEKFKLTIKKVPLLKSGEFATVTPIGDKPLSVQKFIESFTPETEGPKKDINVQTNIIIKQVSGQPKKSVILMTKCNLDNTKLFNGTKLALPVQFKQTDEQHKVTVKVVTPVTQLSVEEDNDYNLESLDHQDTYEPEHDAEQDNEQIPEVAQEVMLEGSEEPPPKTIYIPHKVVIPKLATQCKKIHIAHLQPEAPFYKIVKVGEALHPKKSDVKPKRDIKLPDGTTLVSVNPLAHLLGDTPVEKILEGSKNKHYQPKAKDFESAVAKAMLKLKNNVDAPAPKRRKKNKDEKKL